MGLKFIKGKWQARLDKYLKMNLVETDTELSVIDSVWGPVEWVGEQLNGLGTS